MSSNATQAASTLLSHIAKTSSRPLLCELAKKNSLRPSHLAKERSNLEAENRRERLRQLQSENVHTPKPSSYAFFLIALYPSRRLLARLEAPKSKKALVNHSTLLKRYSELPSPGVACMEPEDFETFMKELLRRRDFVKPGLLASLVGNYYLPLLMLKSYKNQLEQRDAHVKMCWKVVEDVKKAGIPMLEEEQNRLIYLGFFRDRKDILEEIKSAHTSALKKLEPDVAKKYAKFRVSPPPLTWAVYCRLKETLPAKLPLSTVNVLLFSGLRSESFDVVDDLKAMINFSGGELQRLDPDGETFLTLIYGYTDYGKYNTAFEYASIMIDRWPQLVDIKAVNAIIRALVKSGLDKEAERILQAVTSQITRPLESHECYLKKLTPKDDELYIAALEEGTKCGTHRVFPTENTFLPMLDSLCSSGASFAKIEQLLGIMEHTCQLPLTTRVFIKIFESFKNNEFSPQDAQELLAKVIALHDAYHDISTDLRLKDKIGKLHMHPEVESWLNQAMVSEKANLPVEHGAFLKLLDRLVLLIYEAFDAVTENRDLAGQIAEHKNGLFKQLRQIRGDGSQGVDGPSTAELYRRDEVNYIKKGHLIDLLDMVG